MNQEDVVIGTALGIIGGAGTVLASAIGIVFAKGSDLVSGLFGDKTSKAIETDPKTAEILNERIEQILSRKLDEEISKRKVKQILDDSYPVQGANIGGEDV